MYQATRAAHTRRHPKAKKRQVGRSLYACSGETPKAYVTSDPDADDAASVESRHHNNERKLFLKHLKDQSSVGRTTIKADTATRTHATHNEK